MNQILNYITLASLVCALFFSVKGLREIRRYFDAQNRLNDLTHQRLTALEAEMQKRSGVAPRPAAAGLGAREERNG
jgi:hypothetical protein